MVRLQTEPIRVEELLEAVRDSGDGAVSLFVGAVRDHNRGQRVLRLEYHAYEEMALAELQSIERRTLEEHDVSAVAVVHRLGELGIGETSVAIAVAAAHRDAAFRACRFVIESLKSTVPIWKKEHFEGGTVWIEGSGS